MILPNGILGWFASLVGGGASLGAGFYFIRWLVGLVFGRVDKREAAVDAGFDRLDKGTDKLITRMQEEIESLAGRLTKVEAELEHCREERIRDQEELARLRGLVQGMGEARESASLIIAAERAGDAIVRKIGGKG